jgi:hypothetical protein
LIKEWFMTGYLLATQIVDRLSGNAQGACLAALMDCQQAETLMAQHDWLNALTCSERAAAKFRAIPEAAPLLGIATANAAAALGNLGRHVDAKRAALEGLPLVQQVRGLERTQAALHMTIGVANYLEGDHSNGSAEFAVARELSQNCGATELFRLLDTNEAALKSNRDSGRKWWKFW